MSISERCHMDFQAAGNAPKLQEERESGEERNFSGTCFAAGLEEQL